MLCVFSLSHSPEIETMIILSGCSLSEMKNAFKEKTGGESSGPAALNLVKYFESLFPLNLISSDFLKFIWAHFADSLSSYLSGHILPIVCLHIYLGTFCRLFVFLFIWAHFADSLSSYLSGHILPIVCLHIYLGTFCRLFVFLFIWAHFADCLSSYLSGHILPIVCLHIYLGTFCRLFVFIFIWAHFADCLSSYFHL